MARSSRVRRFLAAATLLLSTSTTALPTEVHVDHIVEQREVAHGAPSPWVTVDTSGKATTIIPTVTSVNGAATTISPPPDALLKMGTYTLSPTSGSVTTSTGLAPVATASSSAGDGAFLACNLYQGADKPFCQPKAGSKLSPGKTYYITWSDTYFSNASTPLELQAVYHSSSSSSSEAAPGFTSSRMPASRGFCIWSIPSDFLTSQPNPPSSLNVSLSLAYFEDLYGNEVEDVPGPTVIVTSDGASDPDSVVKKGGTNTVAIAVPVVVVIVLLGLTGLCVWSWRRHGSVPVLGALKRRSTGGGQGYGVRQSRAQRTGERNGGVSTAQPGDKKAGGVELTDRESWSPTGTGTGTRGGNVFREEMERQERER